MLINNRSALNLPKNTSSTDGEFNFNDFGSLTRMSRENAARIQSDPLNHTVNSIAQNQIQRTTGPRNIATEPEALKPFEPERSQSLQIGSIRTRGESEFDMMAKKVTHTAFSAPSNRNPNEIFDFD